MRYSTRAYQIDQPSLYDAPASGHELEDVNEPRCKHWYSNEKRGNGLLFLVDGVIDTVFK